MLVAGLACIYESIQLMIEPEPSTPDEGHFHELDSIQHLDGRGLLAAVCDLSKDKGDEDWGYIEDPIIRLHGTPGKYSNAGARRWGIIVHVILVAYMLLGLNTVCDLYFTGALQELVDKWNIKPDVAGATFMAAGGSAPELFTSLIGAVVTKNDVGFGTIVGSAVFNVLAVIGACGVSALEPIPLTWWPLFRDCCYYIYGLALLAAFSHGKALDCSDGTKQGGGAVSLLEAIILFLSYVLYCVIMYYNERIEEMLPKKKDKATVVEIEKVPAEVGNPAIENKSDGLKELRVSDHEDSQDPIGGIESTNHSGLRISASDLESAPGPPEHHIGRDQAVDHTPSDKGAASQMSHHSQLPQLGHHSSMTIPGIVGNPARIPSNNSGQVRTSSHNANKGHRLSEVLNNPEHQTIRVGKHHRVVYGDDGLKHDIYASPRPDGERRPSKTGIHCGERRPSRSGEAKLQEHLATLKVDSIGGQTKVQEVGSRQSDMTKDSDDDLEKEVLKDAPAKSQDGDDDETKTSNSGGSTETDDIEALMWRPSDLTGQLQWYLSLPIYAPLYYCIPRPDGVRGFIPAFILSLVFIAGFSFVLVYCVELFGKAILGGGNNVTIVMSFTLLAAGTSIPDLVSSMAVARASQGDMAVSSSIGSNIFDILVGLPVPWMIKIVAVDMLGDGKSYDDAQVRIKSPYIALYVILLLLMVFCVICSIHILGWRLNFQLGLCMAILYLVFLGIVLPVELVNKGPFL